MGHIRKSYKGNNKYIEQWEVSFNGRLHAFLVMYNISTGVPAKYAGDVIVSDEEAGRCLDPEGNGVNLGGGNGGGPGPPGREQEKQ